MLASLGDESCSKLLRKGQQLAKLEPKANKTMLTRRPVVVVVILVVVVLFFP